MIAKPTWMRLQLPILALALIVPAVGTTDAQAAPVKLVPSRHMGEKVDQTTGGNVCVTESIDKCQSALASSEPGGFEYPEGVAGGAGGDVYVADRGNNRVQELTASGEFVLMFGKKVNKTTGGNVCTKESHDTCGTGEPASVAEAFDKPQSIAVDPSSENVYVVDYANWRVDEYSSDGEFILMFGKEVNKKGGNLCTKSETSECKTGLQRESVNLEKGAFNFVQGAGNLLAVGGGSEHILYVGDEDRIQEFDSAGEWKGEIQPAANSPITSIVVDDSTEAIYVIDNREPIVRELGTKGEELKHFEVPPHEAGKPVEVGAIALDPDGHLAVLAYEGEGSTIPGAILQLGILYEANDGQQITEFTTPGPILSIEFEPQPQKIMHLGFNGHGELYAAITAGKHELWSYLPRSVAELLGEPATCVPGAEHETDITLDCTLNGKVDPWGVAGTEAWFQWGRTAALGEETVHQRIENVKKPPIEGEEEPFVPVSAVVGGVRPNESSFYYRLEGRDDNVVPSEVLVSFPTLSFTTGPVAPKLVGEPAALFVKPSSAVLFGELNPENDESEYFFEYAPASRALDERCPQGLSSPERVHCEEEGVTSTAVLKSAQYKRIGATLQTGALRSGTSYDYRLAASNGAGASLGSVATFSTSATPEVRAQTGPASVLSATSAIVTGTIEPGGQASTYAFELGIYKGASTQYGVVLSAPIEAGAAIAPESLSLSGLQPGTMYAYRISAHFGRSTENGYQSVAMGLPLTFMTPGLPEALPATAVPEFLPPPSFGFPKPAPLPKRCKRGYKRTKQGKCVKSKAKTKRKKKKARKR